MLDLAGPGAVVNGNLMLHFQLHLGTGMALRVGAEAVDGVGEVVEVHGLWWSRVMVAVCGVVVIEPGDGLGRVHWLLVDCVVVVGWSENGCAVLEGGESGGVAGAEVGE